MSENVDIHVNIDTDISNAKKKVTELNKFIDEFKVSSFPKVDDGSLKRLNELKKEINNLISSGNYKSVSGSQELYNSLSRLGSLMDSIRGRAGVDTSSVTNGLMDAEFVVHKLSNSLSYIQRMKFANIKNIDYGIPKTFSLKDYKLSGTGAKDDIIDKNVLTNDVRYVENALKGLYSYYKGIDFSAEPEKVARNIVGLITYIDSLKSTLNGLNFNNLKNSDISSLTGKVEEQMAQLSAKLRNDASKIGLDVDKLISDEVSDGLKSRVQKDMQTIRNEVTDSVMINKDRKATMTVPTGVQGVDKESPNIDYAKKAKDMRSTFESNMKSISTFSNKILKSMSSATKTTVKTSSKYILASYKETFSILGSAYKKIFSIGSGNASNLLGNRLMSTVKSYLPMFGAMGGVALLEKATTLGGDLVEEQHIVDQVFGNMNKDVNDFTDNISNKFGLSAKEARNFTGIFGAMLSSSDITGDKMKVMSENLTGLSADLSSFYNISKDDAYKKLRSAMAGQVMPLRSLGINMTKANLEAYAMSKGITTAYNDMSQASQVALRYSFILDHTRQMQGDFASTSMSWANQIRILKSQFQTFLTLLGQGLVKVLYPFLTAINKALSGVNTLMTSLGEKFGFAEKDLEQQFGSGAVTDFSDDLSDATDDMNDLADATENANGQLAGFDKINNLTTDKSKKKGSNKGVDIDIPIDSYVDKVKEPDTSDIKTVFDKIADKMNQYWKDISKHVDYKPLESSFKKVGERLKPLGMDLGKGVDWAWKNVFFPFYKWSAEQGAPACLELLAESLRSLHLIIGAVSPEIDSFWKNTLAPFLSREGDAFVNTINGWTDSLRVWNDGLEESDDKIQYLRDTIDSLWSDFSSKHPEIAKYLEESYGNIKGIVDYVKGNSDVLKVTFETLADSAGKLASCSLSNITSWAEFIVTNSDKISAFFDMLVDEFDDISKYATNWSQDMFEYILDHKDDVQTIIDNVKNFVEFIMNFISNHKDEIMSLVKFASEHLGLIAGLSMGGKLLGDVGGLIIKFASFKGAITGVDTVLGGLATTGSTVGASLMNSLGSILLNPITLTAGVTAAVAYKMYTDNEELNKSLEEQYQGVKKAVQDKFDKNPITEDVKADINFDDDDSIEKAINGHSFNKDSVTNVYSGIVDSYKNAQKDIEEQYKNGEISEQEHNDKMIKLREDYAKKVTETSSDFYKKSQLNKNTDGKDNVGAIEGIFSKKELDNMTKTGSYDNYSKIGAKMTLGKMANSKISDKYKVQIQAMLDKDLSKEELNKGIADIVKEIQSDQESRIQATATMMVDQQSKDKTLFEMQIAGSEANQYLAQGLQDSRFLVDQENMAVYDTVTGTWYGIDADMYANGQLSITGVANGMTDNQYILDEANGLAYNTVTGQWEPLTQDMYNNGVTACSGLSDAFIEKIPDVSSSASEVKDSAVASADASSEMNDSGKKSIDALDAGMESQSGSVIDTIGNIFSSIGDWFKNKYEYFSNMGSSVMKWVVEGLGGNYDDFVDTFKNASSDSIDATNDTFEIHSPSHVFRRIGNFIMKGIDLGLGDGSSDVFGSMKGVANGMSASLSNGLSFNNSGLNDFKSDFYSTMYGMDKDSIAFANNMRKSMAVQGSYGQSKIAFDFNSKNSVSSDNADLNNAIAKANANNNLSDGISDVSMLLQKLLLNKNSNKDKIEVVIKSDAFDNRIIQVVNRNKKNGGQF